MGCGGTGPSSRRRSVSMTVWSSLLTMGIHGPELWSTDGTPEGTGLVADLSPGPTGSAPEWLVAADGYLYFTADDGVNGRQLWQLPVSEV